MIYREHNNQPGYIWDDYRHEDHLLAKSPRLTRKVEQAKTVIYDWLLRCHRPYVAVSGGKDSVCVCHLLAQVATNLPPTMWHDSGVEWPETDVVLRRLQEMDLIRRLIIVRPKHDVLDLKRRQEAGEISAALKDQMALFGPINQAVIQHNFDGVALGLRKEESRGRHLNLCRRGLIYRHSDGLLRCNPIGGWSWQDVFAYIARHRLPLHPIYSAPLYNLEHRGRIRLSWWASTDHHRHGQIQWVQFVYPEIYQRLIQALPQVRQYT